METTTIGPGQIITPFTLNPVDAAQAGEFGLWPADMIRVEPDEDGDFIVDEHIRRIVLVISNRPVSLTDEWQWFDTVSGPTVRVRRADCGLGCKCGGEYVITTVTENS